MSSPLYLETDIDPTEYGPSEFGLMDEDGNPPPEEDEND